jgi:hypothetical protein
MALNRFFSCFLTLLAINQWDVDLLLMAIGGIVESNQIKSN